jgi:hypothetical protein
LSQDRSLDMDTNRLLSTGTTELAQRFHCPDRRATRLAAAGASSPGRSSYRVALNTKPGSGAGDGVRTRDMQLGRLPLCQLSYSRPRGLDATRGSVARRGASTQGVPLRQQEAVETNLGRRDRLVGACPPRSRFPVPAGHGIPPVAGALPPAQAGPTASAGRGRCERQGRVGGLLEHGPRRQRRVRRPRTHRRAIRQGQCVHANPGMDTLAITVSSKQRRRGRVASLCTRRAVHGPGRPVGGTGRAPVYGAAVWSLPAHVVGDQRPRRAARAAASAAASGLA